MRRKKKKRIPVFCSRTEDAQSGGWLRQGRVSKIHLAVCDLIQGWAPLSARLYVCWADPEPCLGFSITPRADTGVSPQSREAGRCSISWETAGNKCERSACWSSSLAEAKFKSHNKIVCHREAINGDWFITDAGRVMATPPAEVRTHGSRSSLKTEKVRVNEDSQSEKYQLRHMSLRARAAYLWANFSSFFFLSLSLSTGCTTALEMLLNCSISQSGWGYV